MEASPKLLSKRVGQRTDGILSHEVDGAAAEATAGHARPVDARDADRDIDATSSSGQLTS